MEMTATVAILGLAAALCFRIAWEEWKWPSKANADRDGDER